MYEILFWQENFVRCFSMVSLTRVNKMINKIIVKLKINYTMK